MLNRVLYACSFIVFRIESMREHDQENKYLWIMVYFYDEINIKYLKVYAQDFFKIMKKLIIYHWIVYTEFWKPPLRMVKKVPLQQQLPKNKIWKKKSMSVINYRGHRTISNVFVLPIFKFILTLYKL